MEQGATIVNHGQTHAHLIRRKDNESETEWRERMSYDVLSAQQAIDEKLGPQPKYFAYPFGEYSPAQICRSCWMSGAFWVLLSIRTMESLQ